jgi:hypothetical protein
LCEFSSRLWNGNVFVLVIRYALTTIPSLLMKTERCTELRATVVYWSMKPAAKREIFFLIVR